MADRLHGVIWLIDGDSGGFSGPSAKVLESEKLVAPHIRLDCITSLQPHYRVPAPSLGHILHTKDGTMRARCIVATGS